MDPRGKAILWRAYLALTRNADLPEGFNVANLVFLEKAAETFSMMGIPTPPLEHRPISLGNTDSKHMALALSKPLVRYADSVIGEAQQGFIKGRQMLLNVLRMDLR